MDPQLNTSNNPPPIQLPQQARVRFNGPKAAPRKSMGLSVTTSAPSNGLTTADVALPTSQRERELLDVIPQLWHSEREQAVVAKQSREKQAKRRVELGEHLAEYKTLLVAAGRNGRWTAFLKEHKIPKSTADRYVEQYLHAKAKADGNLPTEELSALTSEQITTIARKIAASLKKKLTKLEECDQFLAQLGKIMREAPMNPPDAKAN